MNDQQIIVLTQEISDQFKDISIQNISLMVIKIMQEVGKFDRLSGQEKKSTVVNIITQISKDKIQDPALETIIVALIPSIIDQLIEVEQGKIKFNKKKCSCLFKCMN